MERPKIVVAGATGFLGGVLTQYFVKRGNTVYALCRKLPATSQQHVKYVLWDGETLGNWAEALEGAEMLINMVGRSVDCRYNEKNKAQILNSRINSTKILGEAVLARADPPKLWINSSSATIYRHSEDKAMNEYDGELGDTFSEQVCKAWEATFHACYTPHTRKVVIRSAIVFGNSGGVLPVLRSLTAKGLGGKQGSGKQYVSWIHEHDFCRAIEYIAQHPVMSGVYNLSSPNPVRNEEMMTTLRLDMGKLIGMPSTKWMLEIGAILLQTETELVLKSRRVVPQKLLDAGFEFCFPNVWHALKELSVGKMLV